MRRLGGVQVDLYQGDPETFVCDGRIRSAAALAAADVEGKRHICIVAPADAKGEVVMGALKEALLGRAPGALGRVTVILSTLDHYWSFQDALFSLFPDEE